MANTEATSNKLLKYNTEIEKAVTAATADTADLAEVFEVTPTKADNNYIIEISTPTALAGIMTYSIAAGDFFASTVAKTGSVAAGKTEIIQLEGAKYIQDTGKVLVTLTPASGKKLKTDHAATITAIELV